MIEIICDNCEKPFRVEESNAGGKVPCPLCGDVNRVPAAATPREAAVHAPDEPLPPEAGPETEICTVRPAMFRAHPFRGVVVFVLIAGGIAGAIMAGRAETTWLVWAALAPVVFGLLWLLKWWVAAHMWVKMTISNKRTVRHEGIVTRRTSEVLHDHVRNVEIRQTFLQRVMGVGYIGISSAGQDEIEIQVSDIPRPYKVKEIIDRYRDM